MGMVSCLLSDRVSPYWTRPTPAPTPSAERRAPSHPRASCRVCCLFTHCSACGSAPLGIVAAVAVAGAVLLVLILTQGVVATREGHERAAGGGAGTMSLLGPCLKYSTRAPTSAPLPAAALSRRRSHRSSSRSRSSSSSSSRRDGLMSHSASNGVRTTLAARAHVH